MNKPKNVFDERDALRRENERLKSEIAALVNRPCLHVHTGREGTSYCRLAETNGVELSQLRAVADAAVAGQIVNNAMSLIEDETPLDSRPPAYYDALNVLRHAGRVADFDLRAAVAEYRKLKEGECRDVETTICNEDTAANGVLA